MVKKLKILKYLFFISFIFFGCRKEIPQLSNEQIQQNAINEIRKIVGNNSIITVLNNKSTIHSLSIDENISTTVTIEQLKDLYALVNDKSRFVFSNLNKVSVLATQNELKTTSLSNFGEFSDPLRPGLYKAIFKGPTFLYSTVIYFRIGNSGGVEGTPSATISPNYLYDPYTFSITSWSAISYNSYSSISKFSISGSLGMNVGMGGMAFNVVSRDIFFDFTVNSDDGIVGLK
jgi:uncharacterized protein YfkK (UPF0435 family)